MAKSVPPVRLLLAGLMAVACAAPARAWWNGDWTMRKKITLDTSATGAAINDPIGGVPVLIRLSDANFRFADAKPDGSDLRFIAEDDRTPLSFHIEKFDSVLDEALIWVRVPDLKPAAKTGIWIYYANSGSLPAKVEDPKGTYDANTVLVYHFSEHGQPAFDFSGSGNTALNPGTPIDGSLIGGGIRLDGKNTLGLPASPTLAVSGRSALTWSAWIKYQAPQANAVLYSQRDSFGAFVIGVDNGVPYLEVTNGSTVQRTPPGATLPINSWHHLAVVADVPRITLDVDGAPYAALNSSLPALTTSALVGGVGQGGIGFVGEMDELEISSVARPAGAVRLAAVSQGADAAARFISFGQDEQQTNWLSGFKSGYIGVIISSLSTDGWAVICILGVMSLISWTVMIRKAKYLSRIGKGNEQFLRELRRVAADLSVLEENGGEGGESADPGFTNHRAMRNAPLFRIYHIGIEEIRHRLAADQSSAGRKALSGRSIQAIRASLDGGLVRESTRLSSQMVLLTIAISGGPFLGLLGTVVGVMITFAAVAQAGDVNVNAIAPGIAAALAATVAGLGVAIPALFGYNYLLTQIKTATSDMHVFIDEFVTKLAEFYRGGSGGSTDAPY